MVKQLIVIDPDTFGENVVRSLIIKNPALIIEEAVENPS